MVEVHLITAMILGDGDQLRYDVMFRVIGLDALQFTSSVVNWDQFIQVHNQTDNLFSAGPKGGGRMSLQEVVSEVVMRFGAPKVSFHEDWSWLRYAENMRTMVHMEKLVKASRLGDLMVIGSLLDGDVGPTTNVVWRDDDMCVQRGNLFSHVWIKHGVAYVVRRLTECKIGRQSWNEAVALLIEDVYGDTPEWWT